MSDTSHSVSVRNLASFCFRSGSIISGFSTNDFEMGQIGHTTYQKAQPDTYLSEVTLSHTVISNGIKITVSGRADGIIPDSHPPTLEELKTTSKPLSDITESDHPVYWAQAKIYAYIWCIENHIDEIIVRLVYIDPLSMDTRRFEVFQTLASLRSFWDDVIIQYTEWLAVLGNHFIARDSSIASLSFPFEEFRRGQRDFSVGVYKSIKEQRHFFVQAPTGTGKTAAALFPAIKALGEGLTDKIFYLTARNTTRDTAQKHMALLAARGLNVKTLTVYAKDFLCILDTPNCHPDYCTHAKGYFNRIQDAISDIFFNEKIWDMTLILFYANKHKVCPFEFCLDLSELADVIICDYNYIFDPRVSLKRYFSAGPVPYCVLIDEAHNLVSRARSMFSATLEKQIFLDVRRELGDSLPAVKKSINKINKIFIDERKSIESHIGQRSETDPPETLTDLLKEFSHLSSTWLKRNIPTSFRESLLGLYFEAQAFINVYECYSDDYCTLYKKNGSSFEITLFCIDPARLLRYTIKKLASVTFFSATLSPFDYYINVLGKLTDAYRLMLPTPYNPKRLKVIIASNVNTRYKVREQSITPIITYIESISLSRIGNYLVFFPSYAYMTQVISSLDVLFLDKINLIMQSREMNEAERENFLNHFQSPATEKTTLGFAVLGGIFGESIDLIGEKLIGAIVVSTGLPQFDIKQSLIQNYYQTDFNGFDYAYTYPGMNRVLQAAGRVIRSDSDFGSLLLIDDRFLTSQYQTLIPKEWRHYTIVKNANDCTKCLKTFWNHIDQKQNKEN